MKMTFEQSKEILESAGLTVEEDTLKEKSKLADTFIHSICLEIDKYFSEKIQSILNTTK